MLSGLCSQLPAQSSWHPCQLLSGKSTRRIFCSNEAPLWGLLVGGQPPERPAMISTWDFQPHLPSSRREEALEMELITDHAYWKKPPKKPSSRGFMLVSVKQASCRVCERFYQMTKSRGRRSGEVLRDRHLIRSSPPEGFLESVRNQWHRNSKPIWVSASYSYAH